MRAENNVKTNDLIYTVFSSFGQKMYGKKELKILPFRFIGWFLPQFFDISVRAFLILIGQEGLCNFKIT